MGCEQEHARPVDGLNAEVQRWTGANRRLHFAEVQHKRGALPHLRKTRQMLRALRPRAMRRRTIGLLLEPIEDSDENPQRRQPAMICAPRVLAHV